MAKNKGKVIYKNLEYNNIVLNKIIREERIDVEERMILKVISVN
jgi:hypothetical protein